MQDSDKKDWVVYDETECVHYDSSELEKSLSRADTIIDTRVIQALDLRIGGMPWALIAEELEVEITHSLINQVKSTLNKCIVDNVEEYRVVESMRLDKLWGVAYPLAMEGGVDGKPDWNAFDRCLRVSSQRRELLGLDVPKKSIVDARVEVKHSAKEYSDAELIDIIAKEDMGGGFIGNGDKDGSGGDKSDDVIGVFSDKDGA